MLEGTIWFRGKEMKWIDNYYKELYFGKKEGKMKKYWEYWEYFKYIIQHKWYVFIECINEKIIWHGITHDLSKFLPSEFFPYTNKFYGDGKGCFFDKAWLLHYRRNKHHWDYWVDSKGEPIQMPKKYIIQMICDWRAMGRKFNDTAFIFYSKNKGRMVLHKETIKIIDSLLKE